MSDNNIHSGHRERLRNRFLSTGALGFSEHELLELMLFYAIPRSDTNELAHTLLNRFGNISNILKADISELSEVKGLGQSAAMLIKLIDSVTKTVGEETISSFTAEPLATLHSDLLCRSENVTEDCFTVYCINSRNYLSDTCTYPLNAFLSGEIRPRMIIEDVVTTDAPNVIIGICHKNRRPVPTQTDYKLIRNLSALLSNINVTVTDTLIAGRDTCFSLRSDGAFSF